MSEPTPCQCLADALHAACVALNEARAERSDAGHEPAAPPDWMERCGKHVALALAAVPDSVLRAWLMQERTIGGAEIYQTIRAGVSARSEGSQHA